MALNKSATIKRIWTALVLASVVLLLIWVPWFKLPFTLFVAVLACIGLWEFFALAHKRGIEAELASSFAVVLVMVFTPYLYSQPSLGFVLTLGFIAIATFHLYFQYHTIMSLSVACLGVLYAGWLPAHFVLLRMSGPTGPGLLTLLLVVIALSDSAAYLVGSLIGRHKMAPRISPNKSWEGAWAGVFAGVLGAIICYGIRQAIAPAAFPDWSLWDYAVTGVVLSITGQVGDFAESMLKRDAVVKDSGFIFPGHGGVLDRCDGYLFAGPVLFYWVTML